MKIYLINLDRSPERLTWMMRQCEEQGVELVRVPAVDAKGLSDAEMDQLRGMSSGRSSLSAPELACFLSHRRTWAAIADGDEPWAFVAEDDIHLSPTFGTFMRNPDWVPHGVEIVKGETVFSLQELSFQVFGRPFGRQLRKIYSYHFGAAGYFISKMSARRILDYSSSRCEPVDELLFSPVLGLLRSVNVMQLVPAICIQDNYLPKHPNEFMFESAISEERIRFRRFDPKSPRPKGWAKFAREIRRLGRQAVEPVRRALMTTFRRSIFQRIAFK